MNKLAFVSSPLKGDYYNNIKFAQKCSKFALEQSYNPYTPHLYFTQFLNDDNEAERNLGMQAGLKMIERCDVLLVFFKEGPDNYISNGMSIEIEAAKKAGKPILYYKEQGDAFVPVEMAAKLNLKQKSSVDIDNIISKLSDIPGILGTKAYEHSHPNGVYDPASECFDEYAEIAAAVDEAIELLNEKKESLNERGK